MEQFPILKEFRDIFLEEIPRLPPKRDLDFTIDVMSGSTPVIADFTTLGRSHIFGLPCPYADSLDPMELYYTLLFQYYPQKSHVYNYT